MKKKETKGNTVVKNGNLDFAAYYDYQCKKLIYHKDNKFW